MDENKQLTHGTQNSDVKVFAKRFLAWIEQTLTQFEGDDPHAVVNIEISFVDRQMLGHVSRFVEREFTRLGKVGRKPQANPNRNAEYQRKFRAKKRPSNKNG